MNVLFRNMSMAKRLLIGPAVVLVFLLGISVLSGFGIYTQKNALADIFNNRFKNYQKSSRIQVDVIQCHSDIYKILGWSAGGFNKDKSETLIKSIDARLAANVTLLNVILKSEDLTKEERKYFKTALDMIKAYQTAATGVLDVAIVDSALGAMYMGAADDYQFLALNKTLQELLTLEDKLSQEKYNFSVHDINTKLTLFVILLAGAIILSVIVTLLISRAITTPIKNVINGLTDGADRVTTAASQVGVSSETLSEGTLRQAASVEETSSSLEQMTAMTKQNANNANQAKTFMDEVNKIVGVVNNHMTEMVKAIDDVSRSSEETDKIVKTIDDIAFQTNLLALNAAVEAARAGEVGAGFAVVADEVRNLAMRAAEAAKQTRKMIENTITVVKNSHTLTKRTQDAFRDNVEIARKVGQLVEEIASASQEQATGIQHISQAVSEMDKVVQHNSSNAELSVSTAEELSNQASEMKLHVAELVVVVDGRI